MLYLEHNYSGVPTHKTRVIATTQKPISHLGFDDPAIHLGFKADDSRPLLHREEVDALYGTALPKHFSLACEHCGRIHLFT